jgi:hypothetical protein
MEELRHFLSILQSLEGGHDSREVGHEALVSAGATVYRSFLGSQERSIDLAPRLEPDNSRKVIPIVTYGSSEELSESVSEGVLG